MKTSLLKFSALLLAVLILSSRAYAQAVRTGRSVALAGSGALGMYGVQAAGWNPANLGLKANPSFSFSFLSFSAVFGNNAFTPKYISETFVEGDTLTRETIDDILSKMDANRLKLYTMLGLPVFGLSTKNFAFNIDAHVFADASIPRDVFEMAMTGPVKDTLYDLSTVEQNAIGYSTVSLSAAKSFRGIPHTTEFAAGVTFKYIIGGAYTELVHKEGSLQITDDKIHAQGLFKFINSKNIGDGVGLDLGAAGRLHWMDLYVGATLGNLIGSVTWGELDVGEVQFSRDDGLALDSVSKQDYWNNFLTQTDTTYGYEGSVTKALPRYLILSADLPYLHGKGDLFFTYYQGFNETPAQNTTPRLALGSEFRWLPFLPLRAGVAVGGIEGTEVAGGFGLSLIGYQLNVGASWQRGVLAGAQGFSIAVTNYFGPAFKRPAK